MYPKGWIGEMADYAEWIETTAMWIVMRIGDAPSDCGDRPMVFVRLCRSEADAVEIAAGYALAFVFKSIEVRQKPPRRR
jgi:hypothetical protein